MDDTSDLFKQKNKANLVKSPEAVEPFFYLKEGEADKPSKGQQASPMDQDIEQNKMLLIDIIAELITEKLISEIT